MFQKLFGNKPVKVEKKPVVIVSGLPRSGTSMMMKMLAEGGLTFVTDAVREADEDNPNGYFEIEASKALKDGDYSWIYDAQGKVVKVISYLLEYLPEDLTYHIIFMDRDIPEILASQKKMLERRSETSAISDEEMSAQFQEHLRAVKYWVARMPNMRIHYVKYTDAINEAGEVAKSISEFLGQPLNIEKMQAVPTESLYRNRSK